jgi:hypothetical protein
MEKHGQAAVEVCRRHPPALSSLLGNFGKTSLRARSLCRLLLAFDVSARVLAWFSRLFENHRPELPWYQFLHR